MHTPQLNSEKTVSKASLPIETAQADFASCAKVQVPLRVYLVEDSPQVRNLLLDFLHEPGEVEIIGYAETEEESVAAIIAQPVSVVIVDLKLREGSGMGVIERLRRANLNPQPKIIVFTNHPFPEIRARAMQLGADYFFDKSADYDSLRATLQTMRTK